MFNEELFVKYPYAFSRNAWTGEIYEDEETGFPYSLDECLPKGWSKLFWMCMEELREPLEKAKQINTFYFLQVKEKYGEMCLYNNGSTEEVLEIINKYEYLSQFVCDVCGKPADIMTHGWIENVCLDCFNKRKDHEQDKFEDIKINTTPIRIRFSQNNREEIKYDYTETWKHYLKEIESERS